MGSGNKPQNYTKSEYERAGNDFYVEPAWSVRALADQIGFRGTVYDPACGSGTIPDVFTERGQRVWSTDLIDRGYVGFDGEQDFLTTTNDQMLNMVRHEREKTVNIVTNPPFDLSVAFVRHSLSMPAVQKVAVIQQLRFLASKERFGLFTQYPPSHVLILSRRPSMPPGDKLAEMLADGTAFKGGAVDYAWFVWDRILGFCGDTKLRWLYPPKE